MTRLAGSIGGAFLAAVVLLGCGPTPAPPSQAPGAAITQAPTMSGITREHAIAAARAAVPRYATAEVLAVTSGRLKDVVSPFAMQQMSPAPAPDRMVWLVTLGTQPSPTGGIGADVLIDFWDGRLIIATEWAS